MEWTREMRYRRLEDVAVEEIEQLKAKVASSPWRQTFHIQPEMGLLNDPNGFSYFNGDYHLFYQWFPLGPVHGLKYWYHTKSKDLVNWENVGVGLAPTESFETHGIFSGTAFAENDRLYLFYTGNVRDQNWTRYPYQCMATMDKNNQIDKYSEPVIDQVPDGYTDHFRDPALFKDGERYYSLIGAQRKDLTGCLLVYQSDDLQSWQYRGELKTAYPNFGHMWECPGYLTYDDRALLIVSPQGLEKDGDNYQNLYQAGYLLGDRIDFETVSFNHEAFVEWDHGFDFYAPQVMRDPSGNDFLVGWMGLPEIEYPTDRHGWAHCLTMPRRLIIENDRVLQQPMEAMQQLRKEKQTLNQTLTDQQVTNLDFVGERYELICSFDQITAEQFGVKVRVGDGEETIFSYHNKDKKLKLDRTNAGVPVGEEYGTTRLTAFEAEQFIFQLFVDQSSIEIFVNNGEKVFTSRIFPSDDSNGITFFAEGGSVQLNAQKWLL